MDTIFEEGPFTTAMIKCFTDGPVHGQNLHYKLGSISARLKSADF